MPYFKKVNKVVNANELNALTVEELLKEGLTYIPDSHDSPSILISTTQRKFSVKEGVNEIGVKFSIATNIEMVDGHVVLGTGEEHSYYQTSIKLLNSALPVYKAIYEFRGLEFPSVTDVKDLTYADLDIINGFGVLLNSTGSAYCNPKLVKESL